MHTKMSTPPDTAVLERALARERAARKAAETQLETRSRELYLAQRQLEAQYRHTVELFASLVGGRRGRSASSLRGLVRIAKAFAAHVGMSEHDQATVRTSAMLCDLGKLVLPEELMSVSVHEMTREQRRVFNQHPRLAYEMIVSLEPLGQVAQLILQHAELYDGSGYPHGLEWSDVSGAQLLCIVKDHDALTSGVLMPDALTEADATQYLIEQRNRRYSSDLVDAWIAFRETMDKREAPSAPVEAALTTVQLTPGLVLTRDLTNEAGVLILGAGQEMTENTIERFRALDRAGKMTFYIEQPPDSD